MGGARAHSYGRRSAHCMKYVYIDMKGGSASANDIEDVMRRR